MPSALFSCSVTNAFLPSGETAMYSGSQSMPGWRTFSPALLAVGVTPPNTGCATTVREATSMMLTLPTGSGRLYGVSATALGVPSLATSRRRPSGVKVTMSGSAPTVIGLVPASGARVTVSYSTTRPGRRRSVLLSKASAATPPWMAMLFRPP